MEVFEKEYQLENKSLSTGELFRMLQDVSTLHCNQLGLGIDTIGPKGLIWVVVRQYLKVERWPEQGELIKLQTWPGRNRHMMFPRFYTLRSEQGEQIMSGSALWTMVDVNTRKMISPAAYGLEMEGLVTGNEAKLPTAPSKLPLENNSRFTVPQEYLDTNCHMNNTRYYDMAEGCLGREIEGLKLREAVTEFVSEAKMGQELKLHWGREAERFYICGEAEGSIFKMSLDYCQE